MALAAALFPGAAVFSQTPTPAPCLQVDPANLAAVLPGVDLVMIGTVRTFNGGGAAAIRPEAILKGPAASTDIPLHYPSSPPPCALARLEDGQRVMVFLTAVGGSADWPTAGQVFWLASGSATGGGAAPATLPEEQLIRQVVAITGQDAVPPAAGAGNAGLDWQSTILPLTLALALIAAAGFALMRLWHRIDPS